MAALSASPPEDVLLVEGDDDDDEEEDGTEDPRFTPTKLGSICFVLARAAGEKALLRMCASCDTLDTRAGAFTGIDTRSGASS